MSTGIQCAADPSCRYAAPPEIGICHEHRRKARLARMQRSSSAWVRGTARILRPTPPGRVRSRTRFRRNTR